MLIAPHQLLEDYLVRVLAERRSASAKALHEEVCSQFQNYSMPAVYKELRKLQEQGVVLKRKGEFSLSLSWILNLVELTDKMHDVYVESAVDADILPLTSKKTSFTFNSLTRVDDFWIHALFVMLQNSSRKTLFQWLPHPWFHLINSHKSFPLHNALRSAGYKVHNIVGGTTFLDMYSKKITTKNVYEFNYSEGPFQKERARYYSVSDEYLFTVHLSEKKAAEIDRFYDSIESFEDYDLSAALNIMTQDAKTLVTIEKNKAKVKKIWNKFVDYFDVSAGEKL